jgi:hypothetical protein
MKLFGSILMLASAAAAAQDPGTAPPPVTYPAIARQSATLAGFIPKGWVLETKATGDLNRDKLPDAALVLHMNDRRNHVASTFGPDEKYNSNPRMLVVAFARKGGGYSLAVADHRLIPRLENQNQDEPFDEVKIAGGTLRLKMHVFMSAGGWRMGGSAYAFRWQNGGFKLIGFDRDSVMRNTGDTEEVSINYLTGRKQLKTGNIGTSVAKERTVRMRRKPLLDLTQIGDGLMFDPDEH